VQTAFSSLTSSNWSTPSTGSGTVTSASGYLKGYLYASNTAVLLRFDATGFNVPTVPEPSFAALGLALAGGTLALARRRRK
jgi:LPXTG-motif cell wall-anchored protein